MPVLLLVNAQFNPKPASLFNVPCFCDSFADAFTSKIPKSPVRELLELEPETAKFE